MCPIFCLNKNCKFPLGFWLFSLVVFSLIYPKRCMRLKSAQFCIFQWFVLSQVVRGRFVMYLNRIKGRLGSWQYGIAIEKKSRKWRFCSSVTFGSAWLILYLSNGGLCCSALSITQISCLQKVAVIFPFVYLWSSKLRNQLHRLRNHIVLGMSPCNNWQIEFSSRRDTNTFSQSCSGK